MRRTVHTMQLLPLLLSGLLAVQLGSASRSGRSLQQAATQYMNPAWTVRGKCSATFLKGFDDVLAAATLSDLKKYPAITNVKQLGKGPCRDFTVDWEPGAYFAGYMFHYSFTGTQDQKTAILKSARKAAGYGRPVASVWSNVVAAPSTLEPTPSGAARTLRANWASTGKNPTYNIEQYAEPAPPQNPVASPSPKPPALPSPSPAPLLSSPSPAPVLTCANGNKGGLWVCSPGFDLRPSPANITNPSNATCCIASPTCATGNNGSSWACPPGTSLKANASSIFSPSNATCCEVLPTCATGNNGGNWSCPAGYVLKPNASSILNPSNVTCCASTCATANNGTSYICPAGYTLKPNPGSISGPSNTTCCDLLPTCANANNGTSFVCTNNLALRPNASTIFSPNITTCCMATCANPGAIINSTAPAFNCPSGYTLKPNSTTITTISNATCCDVVPPNCALIPNSVYNNITNTCQCTATGFTVEAMDGTTLKACLPFPAITCPAGYPIAVKTAEPAIIEMCLTSTIPACPVNFPLEMWGGSPSVLQECRPNSATCAGYPPWTAPVTNANGTLVGCLKPADNACPFVAFREWGPTNPWAMTECRQVTSCPTYILGVTERYTVAGRSSTGQLLACMTLDPNQGASGQQTCPAVTNVADFPVDVTQALPFGCGSATSQCLTARTVECWAANISACPQEHPLQIRRYTSPAMPAPITGCRNMRTTCDLTQAGMTPSNAGADPNAGAYTIVIKTGAVLTGCLQSGAIACPDAYPFPTRPSGVLTECNANGTIIASCPSATSPAGFTVPAVNQAGTIVECLTPTEPCPDAYPISARAQAGNPEKCYARSPTLTCPTDYPFPYYTPLNGEMQLTNCWARGVVPVCQVPIYNGPTGTIGSYPIPIKSNTSQLVGCIYSGATTCPPNYQFALYTDANTLAECREGTGTCSTTGISNIPLRDQGVLVGCTTLDCPGAYPVKVAADSVTVVPVECLSTRSSCGQLQGYTFSLVSNATLQRCMLVQGGRQNCNGLTDYTGLELFDGSGVLVGCTSATETTCPKEWPFAYIAADGSYVSCRSSITGSCAAATLNLYPTPVYDDQNKLVGCTASTSCPTNVPGIATISKNITAPAEQCVVLTSNNCPAITQFGDRSFPLYSGTVAGQPNVPRIVQCIESPPLAVRADCNSAAYYGSYSVEVKGNTEGTGNVIGCMVATPATPCPIGAPFFLMSSNQVVAECRTSRTACSTIINSTYSNYQAEMYSADGGTLYGCMETGATTCPTTAAGAAYNFPFFLMGSTVGDNAWVEECRLSTATVGGVAITDCQPLFTDYRGVAGNNYSVEVINNDTLAGSVPIVGCAKPAVGCMAALGYGVSVVSATGVVLQCRPPATTCSGTYSLPLRSDNGTELEGCMAGTVTDCPSTGPWQFGIYARTAVGTPAARLLECRSIAAGAVTNCSSTAAFGAYNVALVETVSSAVKGCMASDAQCPSPFPKWTLDTNNTLTQCQTATGFTCSLSQIRFWDGASPETLVGCKVGSACPTAAPTNLVPNSIAYSFFTLNAAGTAAIDCRPAGSVASCNGNVEMVSGSFSGTLTGCMSSAATACPDSATYYFPYGLFDIVAPSAAAALKRCLSNEPTCGGLGSGPYVIPLYSTALATVNRTIAGCKALGATCPSVAPVMALDTVASVSFPAASVSNPTISACYSVNDTVNAGCGGGYTVSVCGGAPPSDLAGCTGANLKGCLQTNTSKCYDTNNAQNAGSYPFFVADIGGLSSNNSGDLNALIACFPPQGFSAACPGAYPRRAIRQGGQDLGGCTNQDVSDCNVFWRAYSGNLFDYCT